jgi:hypothetical protein
MKERGDNRRMMSRKVEYSRTRRTACEGRLVGLLMGEGESTISVVGIRDSPDPPQREWAHERRGQVQLHAMQWEVSI